MLCLKTALITGGSRGIGAAAAKVFAAAGYNVVINCVSSANKAEAICQNIRESGGSAIYCLADVASTEQVEKMMSKVYTEFGHIDVLINNAGIGRQQLFTDITKAQWDEMMGVHLGGAFNCTKAVLPDMIRRKSGNIINVSSMWGVTGASCEVHYSTAKAGLIGFTKALAKEVGPSGIRVNCVAPGVIDTEMNSGLNAGDIAALCDETPLGRIGTPEEVARLMLFLCSDGAGFITGQVIGANGGFVI